MNRLTPEKEEVIRDSAGRGGSRFRPRLHIVTGLALLVFGLICAVPGVPGPGGVMIVAALLILADHFVWARKALNWMRSKARQAGLPRWHWLHGRTHGETDSVSHGNGRAYRSRSEQCE